MPRRRINQRKRQTAKGNRRRGRAIQNTEALNIAMKGVRLLLCDVDGVLTDGTVLMGGGIETKRFSIQDGLGLRLLQRAGIQVGWISNRPSSATSQRAKDLKVDFLEQRLGSKATIAEEILAQTGLSWTNVCFIGDDLVDLAIMKRAGVAVAVSNGIHEVKERADYVTHAAGGHGAVREIVEMILRAQKKWTPLVKEYSE